jgi:hypothetical protein
MVLQAVGMPADADRLAAANVRAGQYCSTFRRLGDAHRVPLQAALPVGQAGEQGSGAAGCG